MLKKSIRIFASSLIIVYFIFSFPFLIESINPYNLYIDTKFSEGFTELEFDKINIGDTSAYVTERLGLPIWKTNCGGCWDQSYYVVDNIQKVPENRQCHDACDVEYQYWEYSDDGACKWWDFAWRSFTLAFHKGKVVEKKTSWHYD